MNMIVAYDIADEKRLGAIARIMLDYGTRVQKSIFELQVTPGVFREMQKRVEAVIVAEKDGVKYFPLCGRCSQTVEIIGKGVFTDPDLEYDVF